MILDPIYKEKIGKINGSRHRLSIFIYEVYHIPNIEAILMDKKKWIEVHSNS